MCATRAQGHQGHHPYYPTVPATPSHSIRGYGRVWDDKVPTDGRFKDICYKVFVVVMIVLGATLLVTGILGLMAAKGWLLEGMEAVQKLAVIGEANSCVMIVCGVALFVIATIAWCHHLRKEKEVAVKPAPTPIPKRKLQWDTPITSPS